MMPYYREIIAKQRECQVAIDIVTSDTCRPLQGIPVRLSAVGETSSLFKVVEILNSEPIINHALAAYYDIVLPRDIVDVIVKVGRPSNQYEKTTFAYHYWEQRAKDRDIWEDLRRLLCPDAQRMEESRLIPRIEVRVSEIKVDTAIRKAMVVTGLPEVCYMNVPAAISRVVDSVTDT